MREQYLIQRYRVVSESDDTIILTQALVPGWAGYACALLFFPLGLLALYRRKVTIVIDAPPAAEAIANDKYSDLAKLGQLWKDGVLTEEEFQAKKAKLLL